MNANLARGYNLVEFLAAYNRDLATSRMKSWAAASQFIEWTNGLMAVASTAACKKDATLALPGPTNAAADDNDNETLIADEVEMLS